MIRDGNKYFSHFTSLIVHYDNGQLELSKVLQTCFLNSFDDVSFIETKQEEEPLMQAADLICTFETINSKIEDGRLTKSDLDFFGCKGDIRKSYIKPLWKKRI